MRPHLSMIVSDVARTAAFYTKVFGQPPQKQTNDYVKFDLKKPAFNFVCMSSHRQNISEVSHLGIEVDSAEQLQDWKSLLSKNEIETRDEMSVDCCYAHQDKIWFSDPDGNEWEVFYVKNQLDVPKEKTNTVCDPKMGCCT